MDYEEKYNAALERAKKLQETCDSTAVVGWCEYIFPELKESEDEKIRKDIISYLRNEKIVKRYISDIEIDEWITWLEKQGEQKPQGKSALEAANEEKVDNQNCVKPTDKAEPKFENGQWIVWQDKCYKVNYNGCGYELVDQNGLITSLEYGTIDENAHIWDITKDAKDGDVLVCIGKYGQEIGIIKKYVGKYGGCDKCFETYCFVDWDGIFRTGEYMGSKEIQPATKGQRDTLIKAMANAGYTFDFEKKEFKEILDYDTTRTIK